MEIKLLSEDYLKSDRIYKDFLDDKIGMEEDHWGEDSIYLDEAPDFPIYINVKPEDRFKVYLEAFEAMRKVYLNLPREFHMEGGFWYSLLLTKKRAFLINNYPSIMKSEKEFNNIVLKKFDWENYIYKCVLASQYINDVVKTDKDRIKYYEMVVNNLDLFNYIIKYEIFRNEQFLINVLDIVDENGLSEVLKAKIKGREDLGEDERVGRRVIFELNKSYPVVLAPTLDKSELQVYFMKHLKTYTENIKVSEEIKKNEAKQGIFNIFKKKEPILDVGN